MKLQAAVLFKARLQVMGIVAEMVVDSFYKDAIRRAYVPNPTTMHTNTADKQWREAQGTMAGS
jgi:hypothetical protein